LLILLGDLTFMDPCIVSISNKMQRYTVYLYLETAADSSNGVTNTKCCRYICMSSWWWVEVPPETCRAVFRYKQTAWRCILLDIRTMHLTINVKSPNNISKWHIGFNSSFKGLRICNERAWTGFIWLETIKTVANLWKLWWNSGFYKMPGNFWLTGEVRRLLPRDSARCL
jgi:hypothetical protein